ncbi:15341_t:CDS:2, partial [Racocetra fulgida]
YKQTSYNILRLFTQDRLSNEIIIGSQNREDYITTLLDMIYSNLAENATNTKFITEKTILIPLNCDVNEINKQFIETFLSDQ